MKVAEFATKYGKYSPRQPQVVPFLYLFPEPLTPAEARERVEVEMAGTEARFAELAKQPIGFLGHQDRANLKSYLAIQARRAQREQVPAPSRRQ